MPATQDFGPFFGFTIAVRASAKLICEAVVRGSWFVVNSSWEFLIFVDQQNPTTRQCVVLFRSNLKRRATPLLFFQPTQKTGDNQKLRNFERASESVTLR